MGLLFVFFPPHEVKMQACLISNLFAVPIFRHESFLMILEQLR